MFAPRIALIRASRRTGRHSLAAALEPLESRSLLSLVTSLADSGPGSLRQAILDATAAETIDFAPALANQTIALTSGQLVVDTSVTIAAPPTGPITVSGSNLSRVFWVAPGIDVTMSGLVLTRGTGSAATDDSWSYGRGGALYNAGGDVTLVRCVITNNECRAEYASGGGIANMAGSLILLQTDMEANLVVNDSSSGNRSADGGGLYNASGAAAKLSGVKIVGNRAFAETTDEDAQTSIPSRGGGIWNAGTLVIDGASVTNNRAECESTWNSVVYQSRGGSAYGGGLYNEGDVRIIRTRFTGNLALGGNGVTGRSDYWGSFIAEGWPGGNGGDAQGGAIYLNTGQARIFDTLISENQAVAGHGGNGGSAIPSYAYGAAYGGAGGNGGDAIGGAIAHLGGWVQAVNTVVSDNQSIAGSGGGGGYASSDPRCSNCPAYPGAQGQDGIARGADLAAQKIYTRNLVVTGDTDATLIPALAVEQTIINTGATQRSNITTIALRFDQPTNLPALIQAGDITSVARLQGPAGFLPLAATRYRYDTAATTLTVDLTIDGFGGSQATMLPDGAYQLVVDTTRLTAQGDAQNLLVDADTVLDGVMHVDFHRLLGDFNGDAIVSILDRADLLARFGKRAGQSGYDLAYDLNADGVVSLADYVAWTRRIGQSVPVRRASAART